MWNVHLFLSLLFSGLPGVNGCVCRGLPYPALRVLEATSSSCSSPKGQPGSHTTGRSHNLRRGRLVIVAMTKMGRKEGAEGGTDAPTFVSPRNPLSHVSGRLDTSLLTGVPVEGHCRLDVFGVCAERNLLERAWRYMRSRRHMGPGYGRSLRLPATSRRYFLLFARSRRSAESVNWSRGRIFLNIY